MGNKIRIALLFGSFEGGGAERMMVNLAKGFDSKCLDVEIFVVRGTGPYRDSVPDSIKVNDLNARFGVKSIIKDLRIKILKDNFDVVLSTQMHINAMLGLASIGLKKRPKIIFREANTPSKLCTSKLLKYIYQGLYKFGDFFIAVSEGVRNDMISFYNIPEKNTAVIYNPVVDDSLLNKICEVEHHKWFRDDVEVICGMGRFVPQKGLKDLIEAFNLIRQKRNVKLMIFGAKEQNRSYYQDIISLVEKYNLEDDVWFPGFIDNPFKYIKQCDLFILSSYYEGLPGALIQALACGCPVLSTNCPSGPIEILKGGKIGPLVDVGDVVDMSAKAISVLDSPPKKSELVNRAKYFGIEKCTEKYLDMMHNVISK